MRNLYILIALASLSFSALLGEPYSPKEKQEDEVTPEWSPDQNKKSKFGDDDVLDTNTFLPKKQPKTTNFWVYGATIGSAASINLNLGYYYKDIVVRVSGGRWRPHWYGGQVDLGYTFWKTPVIAHSISVVAGSYQVDPYAPEVGHGGQSSFPTGLNIPGYQWRDPKYEDQFIRAYVAETDPTLALVLEHQSRANQKVYLRQQYIGLTYDILLSNFFLQVGAGIGQGDYKNPQLLLQMGYLFDTR
ncbi:hypothetical protein [Leptospira idonii]|uniref:Uncharacterized protein n=1 Tax=Leptospira idonii TaxID=1193500 RepID=A0A4R9LYQ9_9LEPT|nr:hypothetical protein [Leptospira idonii]TGN19514.1 hypothetical protein EHS15_08710 [Leptospira idonii]